MLDHPCVMAITVRADHGGGPRHLQLLMQGCSSAIRFCVATPAEEPYFQRFCTETAGRVVLVPHRAFRLSALRRMHACITKNGVALIHSHGRGAGLYGRLLAWRTGLPWVHTPHGAQSGGGAGLRSVLNRAYENTTFGRMRRVIYVSEDERVTAVGAGLWRGVSDCVIPNGVVDRPESDRRALRFRWRQSLGISADTFVVATVSRFDYQKNMLAAYEISRRLPDTLFLWLGDGPDRAAICGRLDMSGSCNVRVIPHASNSDTVLAAADVYLSTARWEGLPLSVLEAMALGLPVVLSDVSGHQAIMHSGNVGMTYALSDLDAAVNSLELLRRDTTLRMRLGTNALSTQRRKYSVTGMCRDTLSVYLDILRATN